MALHRVDKVRSDVLTDIYGSADLGLDMPQYKMPEHEHDPRHAYAVVHDELMLDGNSRQNLSTFCQTWVDENIQKLMSESVDKNMIDKDEYPQSAAIEERCVHIIADLWNSPDASQTMGCSTTGSSEAAMLGGMALKWKWREKMRKSGKPIDKPNLVTGPVQVCWHKFARYWDVELREIPVEGDRMLMTPEQVIARCDENTIGVVPTLGVTFTCQYEPVQAVSNALDEFQKKSGIDIPIHVDGASGGFLAPFCDPNLVWDFRLPRVKSINSSGHKFGLAPLGVGWVVWRDKSDLPEDLIFWVNYLGGNMATFALNFSRPGGEIICQYYLFLRLGREGYKRIHDACYATAQHLSDKIEKLGPFRIIYNGRGGIPALSFTLKDQKTAGFSLFDLSDRLRSRGWQVAAYTMLKNREDLVVMRILVRHGFSRDLANLLLEDFQRSLDYFKAHPSTKPLEEHEAAGHNHGGRGHRTPAKAEVQKKTTAA